MTAELERSGLRDRTFRCPKCSQELDPAATDPTGSLQCLRCLSVLSVALFPAFDTPPKEVSTASGETAGEGEAVCFFHPEKRAEVTCARCGRFLCALCDMPLGDRHVCPKCLDTSKMPELANGRFVGAYFSMLLGVIPVILFPISAGCCFYLLPFVGGGAIAAGVASWNKPGSLVHGRRHGMAVVGIIGGVLQLLGVAGMVSAMIYSFKHGK